MGHVGRQGSVNGSEQGIRKSCAGSASDQKQCSTSTCNSKQIRLVT